MAMNIDFTGKTVLVTGGGRGLGKEMALQFAGCGANVYIANRKEDQGLASIKVSVKGIFYGRRFFSVITMNVLPGG